MQQATSQVSTRDPLKCSRLCYNCNGVGYLIYSIRPVSSAISSCYLERLFTVANGTPTDNGTDINSQLKRQLHKQLQWLQRNCMPTLPGLSEAK